MANENSQIWHHLPVEILPLILSHARSSVWPTSYQHNGFDTLNKRGLAAISLTCRYWQLIIRPLLFEQLILRSPDDVAQLILILRSPHIIRQELSKLIRRIIYQKDDDRVPPWTRLAMLAKQIQGLQIYMNTLEARDRQLIDGNSYTHCLPRILPPSAFPPLEGLHISDAIFLHTKRVVKLINSFSRLKRCECVSIVLRSPPTTDSMPIQRMKPDVFTFGIADTHWSGVEFKTRFNAMSAVLSSQRTLGIELSVWEKCVRALTAIIPPTFDLKEICIHTLGV